MPLFAQDVIHKLELGAGRRVLKVGVALIGVLALGLFYNMAGYENLGTAEGMDGAQLARNVAEGRGFITKVIRPLELYLVGRQQGWKEGEVAGMVGRWPDLSNGPVYPLVMAGALKLMPFGYPDVRESGSFTVYGPELWIAGLNQVLLVVCGCLVFWLGRRLFDEGVGWVSAGVFVVSEVFWRHSVSGLPTLWLTFLALALVVLLVRLDERGERASGWGLAGLAFGVGVVTAAAGLTRYGLLGWVVPVVCYVASARGGWAGVRGGAGPGEGVQVVEGGGGVSRAVLGLVAGFGFVLVVVPWLVRNYWWSGSLFGTAWYGAMGYTGQFPGESLMRSLAPDLNGVSVGMIGRKVLLNLREVWVHDLPTLGGSWATGLFLVGLVVPFRSMVNGRVRLFVVGLLMVGVVAQAVMRPTGGEGAVGALMAADYLTPIAPLVFVFGVGLLFTLLDQFTAVAVRYGIVAVFMVCVSAPLLLRFAVPRSSPVAYPPYYPPYAQGKAAYVPEDGWMMSDMPWAIAWYGDRTAVWLPLKHGEAGVEGRNDFYSVHALKPVSALHLTGLTMGKLDATVVGKWRQKEGTDADWERLQARLRGIVEAVGSGSAESGMIVESLKEIYGLADKHWVRGGGEDWESFLLGILVTREVPSGFPLKVAPEGILPEILLTDSEHPATKRIKVSEQADRQ